MEGESDPLFRGRIEILERIAAGAALPETLAALFRLVEVQLPGMHAAIFLKDEDGEHLALHASPSLPPDLLSILMRWKTLDTPCPPVDAMIRREPVFVSCPDAAGGAEDVDSKRVDLHRAWCLPVFDARGRVLGALCVHGSMPQLPDARQRQALGKAAHLASMAVVLSRAEAALRGREVQLGQLYDNVRDIMFLITVHPDETFTFRSVNARFLEATGLREDQIVGKSVEVVIPQPSLSLVLEKYKQAICEKKTVSWEEVTTYPAGVKTGEVNVSPVFNADGVCTTLIGSVHDITERKLLEERLRRSEETFRLLFETSRDGIIVMTEGRECLRANPAAVALFGCSDEQQFLAMHAKERCPIYQPNGRRSDDYAADVMADCEGKEAKYYEWTYRRLDGSEFVAEIMLARMVLDDKPLLHVTIRDITERIETHSRLGRITKLYAALSQCNQAIIHCEDEQSLLDEVCRIAVELGGMKMAWVGMREEATGLLRSVTSYGTGTEYLQGIEVSTDTRKPTGKGPGGTAFRERRPIWSQDFMSDPSLAVWHERGRKFGWRANAALPLYRKGAVVGAFMLYSDVKNAFDEQVQDLLIEMASDISFGLGYIQDKREREVERRQLRRLSQVVQQSHNMVMITDTEGRVEYINPAFEQVTGYAFKEVRGRNASLLKSESTPAATFTDLWSRLKRGEAWQGEIVNRKKDGTEFINLIHVAPLYTIDDQVTHYLSIGEDITEHRHAEWRVEYLANFDELTGLPNRIQLRQLFGYALSIDKRNKDHLALMFVDLDHFKNINDALGHSVGDAVLKEVARRLQEVIEEEDVVSRLGGDEFIVMLPQSSAAGAAKVASKILAAISKLCKVEEQEFVITASIGISVYPQDGRDLETLSKNADMAMYLAKQEGRGCYRFYTEEMQIRTTRTMLLIGEMRYAIAKNQFEVHYQPQISGGRIIGAEALLRWNNPELGMVSPAEFIPAAEESGLILEIGEWVLREAVSQAKAWMDSGMPPLSIAVNLSPVQFRDEGFPQMVAQVIEDSGLPPRLLELEITEGMAMHDPDLAVNLTNGLNALGVRFAIDDFGTGYSSLSYLKKFKIHKLKIDQTFVRDLLVDAEGRAIVSTIINMARNLGLVVIAEGVENEGQYQFLSEQGCEEMQGFYFSKPLSAAEFEVFSKRRATHPHHSD